MFFLKANNVKEAYEGTLRHLLTTASRFDDPEISSEEAAVICVGPDDEAIPSLTLVDGRLVNTFPYARYFPHVNKTFVDKEMDYWNAQFMDEGKLEELLRYLERFPLSKRAIILFWEDKYRDLSKGAVCEIAVFFRVKSGRLEMHTHMRANNASFLLFMDMLVLRNVQLLAAKRLGLRVGEYVHIMDSLHVYEAEHAIAQKQLQIVQTSEDWRLLQYNLHHHEYAPHH